MKGKLRLVFMGSAGFAVPSLEQILEKGFPVMAVVTAPDKPAGRGMKLSRTPVKEFAEARGLKLLQPEKLRDPAFLEELTRLRCDLQVVVAFRMLPEILWNMPPMGTVNLHASLLPDYRGAAPINWALIHGTKTTGLTTFRIRREIDTGPVLMTRRVEIGEKENFGQLEDRMKIAGADLLLRTLEGLEGGTLEEIPQKDLPAPATLHTAPKLTRETGRISWELPSEKIIHLVRGLSPAPGAWTRMGNFTVKILEAESRPGVPQAPGTWIRNPPLTLRFAAADGWVEVLKIQPEGKKTMPVADFLRGYRGP